jgi:hypothetical protein
MRVEKMSEFVELVQNSASESSAEYMGNCELEILMRREKTGEFGDNE